MAKSVRILFVCTANSAYSQMAEGFARFHGGSGLQADSAGTHPTRMDIDAVEAISEVGVDISSQTSDSLDSKNLNGYDHLVTLCGEAEATCPVLPIGLKVAHWGLTDPAAVTGEPFDVLSAFRVVRDQIKARVEDLLQRISLER